MWKKILVYLSFVISCFINQNIIYAESVEVAAVGEYDVGGNDTRERAKVAAYENAKRNALEQVATSIESRTDVSMGMVTRDTILSYAKGKLRIVGSPRYEFSDKGTICWAYIRAIVDVDMEELKNNRGRFVDNSGKSDNNYSNHREQSASSSGILNGAIEFNGHYYKNFEFRLDWEQAQKFCQSVGGHLATMESSAEADVINRLRGKGGWNYWLGGYRDDQGLWRWVTGGTITDSFWRTGEPAGGSSKRNRMLTHKLDKTMQWYSHKGEESWSFICEWDAKENAHDSNM